VAYKLTSVISLRSPNKIASFTLFYVPLLAPSRRSHPKFEDTMKTQFAYLAILAVAAGVKPAIAHGSCIDICYQVEKTADCGKDYAPYWSDAEDCYLCCGIF